MSFNVNLPLGRSNAMSGLTDIRLTSKDPKTIDSVTYNESSQPTEVVYTLVDNTTETITISYDSNGHPTIGSILYKGYGFNIQTASLYPNTSMTASQNTSVYQHAATELQTIEVLGLSTTNMLTDSTGYDILLSSDGSILFSPTTN